MDGTQEHASDGDEDPEAAMPPAPTPQHGPTPGMGLGAVSFLPFSHYDSIGVQWLIRI